MQKISYSLSKENVKVIPRQSIPSLKTVTEDNQLHNLGLLLDFRKNKDLNAFIPEQGRFSLSWVRLKNGESLVPHVHPTASMIVVTQGEGRTLGEIQKPIKTGDIVIVPPHAAHGFVGEGSEGFWALSIQFEGSGLYEDPAHPRVRFLSKGSEKRKIDLVSVLEKDQQKYQAQFKKGGLMRLMNSELMSQPDVKSRLLEALHFWSNWFQRLLAVRVAIGNPRAYQDQAEEHFGEELGHNGSLATIRKYEEISFWDPHLDAAASWFFQKILSGTPEERTILMHCVLEAASFIFHDAAKPFFSETPHFSVHSDLDQHHAQEGFEILKKNSVDTIEPLQEVLRQGWVMAQHLTNRMAEHARKGGKIKSIES